MHAQMGRPRLLARDIDCGVPAGAGFANTDGDVSVSAPMPAAWVPDRIPAMKSTHIHEDEELAP